jgi:hypothetical protein
VLQKNVRVVRLRCVAGVRIHGQLSIGKMLRQEKGVDRHDDDILVPMYNQRWLLNLASMAKLFSEGIAPHSRMASSCTRSNHL